MLDAVCCRYGDGYGRNIVSACAQLATPVQVLSLPYDAGSRALIHTRLDELVTNGVKVVHAIVHGSSDLSLIVEAAIEHASTDRTVSTTLHRSLVLPVAVSTVCADTISACTACVDAGVS